MEWGKFWAFLGSWEGLQEEPVNTPTAAKGARGQGSLGSECRGTQVPLCLQERPHHA